LSYDFVISVPRNREGGALELELALERIEDRIEAIERELAACAPLVRERDRLIRARALVLDDPDPGQLAARSRRVTRDDVVGALGAAPGSRAGELARALGTSPQIISAHLYRGKAGLFDNRGGRWFLRREADQD
jgi:hypothetical protein